MGWMGSNNANQKVQDEGKTTLRYNVLHSGKMVDKGECAGSK